MSTSQRTNSYNGDHNHKHDRRYSIVAIGALILSIITLLLNSETGSSSNGVTITNNGSPARNRIRFPATGMYNIAFSTVFLKSNSSAGAVDIWFRENGVDLPDSNTRVTVAGQAQTVAAWNYFYNCTNTNNYLEVVWWTSDSTTISVHATAATTAPTRPAVPSIILTVNQVGGVATQ